jgi:hypothetical protein
MIKRKIGGFTIFTADSIRLGFTLPSKTSNDKLKAYYGNTAAMADFGLLL